MWFDNYTGPENDNPWNEKQLWIEKQIQDINLKIDFIMQYYQIEWEYKKWLEKKKFEPLAQVIEETKQNVHTLRNDINSSSNNIS